MSGLGEKDNKLYRFSIVVLSILVMAGAVALLLKGRVDQGRQEATGISADTVRHLEQALRRDLASPYLWCDLAEALTETGQLEKARYCFGRAVQLGPRIPPILMRAANFHFRLGEHRQALPYTARIMELAPDYDAIIFSYYDRLIPDAAAVLPHLRGNSRAACSYFRHLLASAQADAAETTWTWLEDLKATDDRLAGEYLDFLLRGRRYKEAAHVWARHLGSRRAGYLESTLLFNGGFESEPTGAVFDWRIRPVQGVEVSRESGSAKEGRNALRIYFSGTTNVEYSHVAQTAYIWPGRYRFRALVRTDGLTTDQGLLFRLLDPESPGRLLVETEQLRGTHDWKFLEAVLAAPAGTNLITVRICRKRSRKFDSKIQGTAWIDSVSLQPLQ